MHKYANNNLAYLVDDTWPFVAIKFLTLVSVGIALVKCEWWCSN